MMGDGGIILVINGWWWVYFGCWKAAVGSGGFVLVVVGSGQYFWVVVGIFWVVVHEDGWW